MKKLLSLLSSTLQGGLRGGLLFLALLATTTLWAYDFQSGDLYYNITSDSTVEVTMGGMGYNANITSANIPESVTYNGNTYSVTNIGDGAFYWCGYLTSITIPNSITNIGMSAFEECYSLISVIIPENVISIRYNAFKNCTSLASVSIPSSVTSIVGTAFSGCVFIKENFINNSSLDAEENNYWGAKVGDAEIDGLLIRDNAVVYCRPHVTSAHIPNGVTSIGNNAFSKCTSLTSITIPNSVTSIGEAAFAHCESLTSIVIPDGVTRIENSTFSYCKSLKSVTIPNSVTSIGEYAFEVCKSLTSISVPDEVTTIEDGAFYHCTSLTSFKIPAKVTKIADGLFGECLALTNINIPNHIDTIGGGAFMYCTSLTSITIPESVNAILGTAFAYCESLQSISLPNTLNEIDEYTFAYCISLDSIEIPNSVTRLGNGAFEGCSSLISINIPNKVTCIDCSCFRVCTSLASITIPNSVTQIGGENPTGGAFGSCHSLTSITIPNSVKSIGICTFSDCSSLKSIVIGKGVRYIDYRVFEDCPALDSIYIYSATPPTTESNTFDTFSATLYVPCDALEDYQAHSIWGRFANIDCIASEEVETQETVVDPSTNEVTITWPMEANAATYTIVIQSGDEVICTLRFNAQGQLLTIAYAPGREGNHPAQYAEQTAKGFRFTVTGLEQGTHYTYDITVQDANNHTIQSHTGEFTTESMTAVDDITTNDKNTLKLLRDNQLLILHDGKTYNIMGMEVMKLR